MGNKLALLLKKQAYDEIIKFTEASSDADAVLYRLQALAALGRDEEALSLIENHFDIIKAKPALVFPIHASLIKQTGDRLEGMKILKRYLELPYESMEVEEAMREFEKWLMTKPTINQFSKTAWEQSIKTDPLKAVYAIPNDHLRDNLDTFVKLLKSPYPFEVRSLALRRLIDLDIDATVTYESDGLVYEVNPHMLTKAEDQEEFILCLANLRKEKEDPALIEMAADLLTQYANAIFPDEPPYEDETRLIRAVFMLVRQYMNMAHAMPLDPIVMNMGEEIDAALKKFVRP